MIQLTDSSARYNWKQAGSLSCAMPIIHNSTLWRIILIRWYFAVCQCTQLLWLNMSSCGCQRIKTRCRLDVSCTARRVLGDNQIPGWACCRKDPTNYHSNRLTISVFQLYYYCSGAFYHAAEMAAPFCKTWHYYEKWNITDCLSGCNNVNKYIKDQTLHQWLKRKHTTSSSIFPVKLIAAHCFLWVKYWSLFNRSDN